MSHGSVASFLQNLNEDLLLATFRFLDTGDIVRLRQVRLVMLRLVRRSDFENGSMILDVQAFPQCRWIEDHLAQYLTA